MRVMIFLIEAIDTENANGEERMLVIAIMTMKTILNRTTIKVEMIIIVITKQ